MIVKLTTANQVTIIQDGAVELHLCPTPSKIRGSTSGLKLKKNNAKTRASVFLARKDGCQGDSEISFSPLISLTPRVREGDVGP